MNKLKGLKTNQGGFIKIIILIVVALAVMQYYNITVYDVLDWFKHLSFNKIIDWLVAAFHSVFRK